MPPQHRRGILLCVFISDEDRDLEQGCSQTHPGKSSEKQLGLASPQRCGTSGSRWRSKTSWIRDGPPKRTFLPGRRSMKSLTQSGVLLLIASISSVVTALTRIFAPLMIPRYVLDGNIVSYWVSGVGIPVLKRQ